MGGTDYAKEGIVHIENLVKRYGSLVALDHLNLDIREGEIFGLLGPNGSGKTTAINCMLALLKYDKGSIRIFGKEMEPDNYEAKGRLVLCSRTWQYLMSLPCMRILTIFAACI